MSIEATRGNFNERAQRVMTRAERFGRAVSDKVGEYEISAGRKINPFFEDGGPGLIEILIDRSDGQEIDPSQIVDLTTRIDQEVDRFGPAKKGAWNHKINQQGQEDKHTLSSWFSFPVRLSPEHIGYLKRRRKSSPTPTDRPF